MVIKSLEQELGTPLFIRKSKGVELTEAGKRIYSYAVNAVRNAEAISALSSQNEIPFLRIVSNSSSHMALLLTHYYLQQKEKLKIEYRECGIEEMMERVSEGMDDLGFLFVPDNRRSVLRHMLEQKIRFGYLKYQGRPLIPGLVDFLSFLEGALEKDHEMI